VAVEEKVVIKVEVDADITNDIAAIRTRLKAIEDHMGAFNRKAKDMDRGMDRVNKRFKKMEGVLTKVTAVFMKFMATLAKFSFIALAGQLGLFTAGLLAAKAALITGRAAASAYQASLRGLSVAAAGVATALAVAAAAMRQFNEVQLGFQFGGGAQGRTNAIRATRGIGSRTRGLLGSEATSAMAGSLGRAGVKPSQTSNVMRQLLNISGGDAKAAQSLASSIGSGDVKKATTALRGGVGFNQGSLKNVSSMQGIMGVVGGGGATGANFQTVGSDMASTFIGTLKTEFAGLSGMFADLGAPLLEPFRKSFTNISRMLKEDVLSMTAVLQKFGAESFAPSIESFIGATSEFIRKNIVNNMSDVKEMGQSFVDFGKAIQEFFLNLGDYLGKLEPAANVVIDMFKAMGGAAGGRGLFQSFNRLIVENADAFKDFGSSIGNVIGALFDQLSGGQMGFFNKLPLLADVFNTLANDVIPSLFGVFNKFAPLMERLPGALESLANVLDMLAPIVETLVSAISGLFGMLGGMGGVGDIGSLALMGGLMMMTKGKGRSLLGRGARGGASAVRGGGAAVARGASAVRGGSAAGGGAFSRGFSRARGQGSGFFSSTARGARGAFQSAAHSSSALKGMHTSLTAGRGAGFLGRAGKLGLLAAGLEGLNMFGDYRDDGFSGIASGYNQRATDSPLFAGLGTGTAASFLLGPQAGLAVGGATTLLGAANRGLAGDNSKGNNLTGALGGAAIGASIGAFGGLPGMAVGAVVGGIIGGVGTFFAGREGQKRLKTASEAAAKKVKLDVAAFKVGSGSAATNLLAGQADLLDKAMNAAIDEETGNQTSEGDTREFRDYLKSIGVDPESVHRDNMLEQLLNDNALADYDSKIEQANALFTGQMDSIAEQTGLSMDEVERVLNDFNIDPFMDYMEDNVAAIINLRNMTIGDLSQVFVPDFSTSAQGVDEMLLTQQGQLGTILSQIEVDGVPQIDSVEDYIGTNTQVNMAAGMSGAQASLAAIQSFGLSLQSNGLGEEAVIGIMQNLGLNKNGSVMTDLLTRMFTEFGFDELEGMTVNDLRNLAFGENTTFLQNDLGFTTGLESAVGLQTTLQAFGSGDAATIEAMGKNPAFAGMTIGDQGEASLADAIMNSDRFNNLVESGSFSRGRGQALSDTFADGITVEELGSLGQQYGLDADTLSGILVDLPTDLGTVMAGVSATIVEGFTNIPRPQVIIDGKVAAERESTTYVIETTITSGSGTVGASGTGPPSGPGGGSSW
tara:strand:- start:2571 stop:6341 length:3771 start_codon:yes stop_codon:yes gene_type:complete